MSAATPASSASVAALIASHGDKVWDWTRSRRSRYHHQTGSCPQSRPQLGRAPLSATCADCEALWAATMALMARKGVTPTPKAATSHLSDAHRSMGHQLHSLAARPERDLRTNKTYRALQAQPELLEIAVQYVLFLRSNDHDPDVRALGRLERRCPVPAGMTIDQALTKAECLIERAAPTWYDNNIDRPRSRRLAVSYAPALPHQDTGREATPAEHTTDAVRDWTRGVRNDTHLDTVLLGHQLSGVASRLRAAAARSCRQRDLRLVTAAVAASLGRLAREPGILDSLLRLPIEDPRSHLHTLVRRHNKTHHTSLTTRQVMECLGEALLATHCRPQPLVNQRPKPRSRARRARTCR